MEKDRVYRRQMLTGQYEVIGKDVVHQMIHYLKIRYWTFG